MEPVLTTFFQKYPVMLSTMTAVKMIHKKVEQAQDVLKKDKSSREYLKHLFIAHSMIEDLFAELGITPETI